MQTKITRLDYQNPIHGHFEFLPMLNNINDVNDINEIWKIQFDFDTQAEAIEFQSKFPKSYNAKLMKNCHASYEPVRCWNTYMVAFEFKTFWKNNVTGEINEAAIKNRIRVVKKIKEII